MPTERIPQLHLAAASFLIPVVILDMAGHELQGPSFLFAPCFVNGRLQPGPLLFDFLLGQNVQPSRQNGRLDHGVLGAIESKRVTEVPYVEELRLDFCSWL